MSIVFSLLGTLVFIVGIVLFITSCRLFTSGALSIPAITLLTAGIYYYLMPILFLLAGEYQWFGLFLNSMELPQLAVGLYMIGAFFAFFSSKAVLEFNPNFGKSIEIQPQFKIVFLVVALAVGAILTKVLLGLLVLTTSRTSDISGSDITGLNFLNLGHSMLLSMMVFYLVKSNFSPKAILIMFGLLVIFLLEGFRFRIVILLTSAVIAFTMMKNIKVRPAFVAAAMFGGITALNAVGLARSYGQGLDLSKLQGMSFGDMFKSFGGEGGPVFVMVHLTETPPPVFVHFEPWTNAVARFVPTFLWPDKPFPDYLYLISDGFPDPAARTAGIAGTQHAEFFLQFGWWGLPILSFLFFKLACLILRQFQKLGLEGRIAGYSLVPPLCGFYAQQRGYTFQIICELIFTLGPLFFIYWRAHDTKEMRQRAWRGK